MKRSTLIIINLILLTITVSAQHEGHNQALESEYVGEEKRTIKSLSEDDIKELKEGRGWGFAKVAELNGIPGPVHLLEMREEIELNEEQISKLEAIYNSMKSKAMIIGEKFIQVEKELNTAFIERMINEKELKKKLQQVGEIRSELRFVHLQAHLKTLEILTENQIVEYNSLRGYNSKNPCNNVPEGHDPVMWKKHNNCS